jgi:hypothetical protein
MKRDCRATPACFSCEPGFGGALLAFSNGAPGMCSLSAIQVLRQGKLGGY